ncbi:MAG: hypothetical protein HOL48_09580 [Porticoccaceae bacterium]|jgi:hypothetical protein|nr:hypothetical protein [Porticoccaceae bacterium]
MLNYGRLIFGGLFLFALFPAATFAGGSIGVDYLSSEIRVAGFRESETEIESSGPGFSLSFDLGERWAVSLSHSSVGSDGAKQTSTVEHISVEVESESTSNGLGLSYYGDNFWAGVRYRQSEDEQQVIGFSRRNSALTADIRQQQESGVLSFEVGRDWLLGNWSPALSVSLSRQELDIERVEQIDNLNLSTLEGLQESLEGVDVGISASLAYYFQLSDRVLLAPSLGFYHQTNISGDVSGLAAYSQSRGDRSFRASQDYREKLNAPENASVDFGINLLAGDWLMSLGVFKSLSERRGQENNASWFAGLSYSF